jgi:DNA mismatch repair ATPase MutS
MPNYLISLQCNHPLYAFALLDTANNKIVIGLSKSLDEFKTVLYRTRPVEVLYDPANLPMDEKKMMT